MPRESSSFPDTLAEPFGGVSPFCFQEDAGLKIFLRKAE
jgi:hypothetical protein